MLDFSVRKLRLINYLLSVFILAAALLLTRNVISVSMTKKPPPDAGSKDRSNVRQPTLKKDLMQYAPILEKNPFGAPGKLYPITVSRTEETESPDVPVTNLVLMGTALGSGRLGYAIFEDSAQTPVQQQVFALGDRVFDYGVLKKIEHASAVIEKNGATFTVSIPDTAIEPLQDQKQIKEPAQPGPFARKVGEREYILDSRRIQKSLDNPEQILTDARLLPNIKNGKQEGFSISEVIPGGIYHSLGLRNGDVLLKINDLEISNAEVAIQAMSALRGMNNVNLDIIRGGQNMSMSYRIK
ncbi:MAG: PDZ domain-containing protein [Nitrospirae bacterium]|nr:PDZ domain-containing protein [Nitrospirota bacterium]